MMRSPLVTLTAGLILAAAACTGAVGAEQGQAETGAGKPAGASGSASGGPDRAKGGAREADKTETGTGSALDAVVGRGSGRSSDDGGALAR